MKYSVDKQEKYTIFSVKHLNLNAMVAPDLKSEFVILRNEEVPNLILDLTEVQFVDSSGLSAILTGNRLWNGFGSFVITGIHEKVKKLITISRLENILTLIPTKQEAIDYVLMEEIERELKKNEE